MPATHALRGLQRTQPLIHTQHLQTTPLHDTPKDTPRPMMLTTALIDTMVINTLNTCLHLHILT